MYFDGRHIGAWHPSGAVSFFAQDALGGEHIVTDASGNVCEDDDTLPFGTDIAYTNNCDQSYKFAGMERDDHNTWRWYRAGLRSIYRHKQLADLKLNEIGREAAAAFAAHRQSLGLEVASNNASLRVLRRVLRLAAEWRVIESAPTVQLLRGERHRERVISAAEEARLRLQGSPIKISRSPGKQRQVNR